MSRDSIRAVNRWRLFHRRKTIYNAAQDIRKLTGSPHLFASANTTLTTMDNDPTVPKQWPDQRLRIMIPTWALLIISTMFLTWRVVYGIVQKRSFLASDYLLIIAAVSRRTFSLKCRLDLTLLGTKYHCSIHVASSDRSRSGASLYGPVGGAKSHAFCILSLDLADHQHHGGGIHQVVYLCIPSGSELF
jgi:hypothetical protein